MFKAGFNLLQPRKILQQLPGVLVIGVLLLSVSCTHDNQDLVVSNIKSIAATPQAISQGGTLTLIVESDAVGNASFLWYTGSGTLSDPQNDTTQWTAPDVPGTYIISVVVTDDLGSHVGTIEVGVDIYLADVIPAYMGINNCAQCHSGVVGQWNSTSHASALATLQGIFQDHNSRCLTCHTVGYDPDINNGGYDEVPVARLANVSCENCHGPGSEHNGDPSGIEVSFDVNTCASCHQGEHHPYFDEWSMSAHATSLESAGGLVTQNPNCIKCHISEAFVAAVKTGAVPEIDDLETINPINCMTCHDPHNHASDGQLRIASVDLVCGECHTSGSIADVQDPGTPHHSQWNMLHGTDGLEYDGFEYPDSPHQFVVEGKCASCHVSSGEESPNKTGHTFEPELRACQTCHPNSTDFDINGVQTSITLLIEQLRAKLDAAGDTESTAYKQASYNLEFVEADASHGVHNYKYAKALLESSIADFNP